MFSSKLDFILHPRKFSSVNNLQYTVVMNIDLNVILSTIDDDGDEMVCSPSVDTLESINSYDVVSYLSEQGVLP